MGRFERAQGLLRVEFDRRGILPLADEILDYLELCRRWERVNRLPVGENRENYRARSCNVKLRLTRYAAELKARDLNQGAPEWSDVSVAYPCIFCGHWHAGKRVDGRHYHDVEEPMTDEKWARERVTVELMWPAWAIDNRTVHTMLLQERLEDFFRIIGRTVEPQLMLEVFEAEYFTS